MTSLLRREEEEEDRASRTGPGREDGMGMGSHWPFIAMDGMDAYLGREISSRRRGGWRGLDWRGAASTGADKLPRPLGAPTGHHRRLTAVAALGSQRRDSAEPTALRRCCCWCTFALRGCAGGAPCGWVRVTDARLLRGTCRWRRAPILNLVHRITSALSQSPPRAHTSTLFRA